MSKMEISQDQKIIHFLMQSNRWDFETIINFKKFLKLLYFLQIDGIIKQKTKSIKKQIISITCKP